MGEGAREIVAEVKRAQRVAELLHRELSMLMIRALKDPRLRGITLTRVHMDDDLRHGRVYFSHLEGKERAAAAQAGFKSASGFIRREIGQALNLRRTPELEFEFDPGIEHAVRIGALLRENLPKE
jgi:ribosome-binding factor A